jgi:hypothetical protein
LTLFLETIHTYKYCLLQLPTDRDPSNFQTCPYKFDSLTEILEHTTTKPKDLSKYKQNVQQLYTSNAIIIIVIEHFRYVHIYYNYEIICIGIVTKTTTAFSSSSMPKTKFMDVIDSSNVPITCRSLCGWYVSLLNWVGCPLLY